MTIKGRLYSTCPMLKAQMAVLGAKEGVKLNFWFCDPQKAHPCAESRLLTYFASKSVRASWL